MDEKVINMIFWFVVFVCGVYSLGENKLKMAFFDPWLSIITIPDSDPHNVFYDFKKLGRKKNYCPLMRNEKEK